MRRHVPFAALWSMQIEVPVSLLVRDVGLAWSCGQCPLDADGQVMAPGDLAAQSEIVADYILEVLARGDLTADGVGLLLAYYVDAGVDNGPAARAAMLATLTRRFGTKVLVVPVPVPHFYYAGMVLEIDVFASTEIGARRQYQADGLEIDVIDGGDLTWAKLSLSAPCPTGELDSALSAVLARAGLSADRLLRDHWYFPDGADEQVEQLTRTGLLTDRGAAVQTAAETPNELLGELTFRRDPATARRDESGAVTLHVKRSGDFLWAVARSSDSRADLVGQTEQVMPALERALTAEGMSFADVLKLTTHYVGGDTPEELHANMQVRNGYYATPGPASTGLPVAGLGDPRSLITVDLTARRSNSGHELAP